MSRAPMRWPAPRLPRRTAAAWVGVVAASLIGLAGCGGGSGGGSADTPGVMWPDRGGGTSTALPPAVVTGRIVFVSASGESCCVAVDPTLLSPTDPGQALLVLDDLAPGPATVTIAGFPTDFAPAVAGIAATCATIPVAAGSPCDPERLAAPSFESSALAVDIVAGAQTNLGEVDVAALPFLPAFSPAQNEVVTSPVFFDFTVADAVTGIRADSVALEVTFERAEGEPPVFRPITKRVPLDLEACADGSEAPCSATGDLDLVGFNALGSMPELPEGEVEARIVAENLAAPPRGLDFRYPFFVAATPTAAPTATATPEDAGAAAPIVSGGADAPAAAGDGNRGAAAVTATPTPTATPASA